MVVSTRMKLDVREVDEPRLDQRRHEHEEREHRDDPELAHAEDEVDEPPRVRRLGDRCGRRGHAASSARCPVAAATIDSSEASAWANSSTSRPSRMTRMRSASAQHLGQLRRDHEDRDARGARARRAAGAPRPSCRCRCRASARRRSAAPAGGRATWRARPSAGSRPRARSSGCQIRPYLSCSRCRPVARRIAAPRRRG